MTTSEHDVNCAVELISLIVLKDIALNPRWEGEIKYWQASFVQQTGSPLRQLNIPTDGWAVGRTPSDAVQHLIDGDTVYKRTEEGDLYLDETAVPRALRTPPRAL